MPEAKFEFRIPHKPTSILKCNELELDGVFQELASFNAGLEIAVLYNKYLQAVAISRLHQLAPTLTHEEIGKKLPRHRSKSYVKQVRNHFDKNSSHFVIQLFFFRRLMEEFPALLVSGLSFTDLVTYGTAIRSFAHINSKFKSLVIVHPSPSTAIEMRMLLDADEDATMEVSTLFENVEIDGEDMSDA